MIKHSILLYGSISCVLLAVSPSKATPVEDVQRLIARQLKWESAQKCVRSMMIENGRVKELCERHQDIYKLANSAGTKPVSIMIKNTLNIISDQDLQLKEGLISDLPVDRPYVEEAILESDRDILSLQRPLIQAIQSTVQSCKSSPYNPKCEPAINQALEAVRGLDLKREFVKKELKNYVASYNQNS